MAIKVKPAFPRVAGPAVQNAPDDQQPTIVITGLSMLKILINLPSSDFNYARLPLLRAPPLIFA